MADKDNRERMFALAGAGLLAAGAFGNRDGGDDLPENQSPTAEFTISVNGSTVTTDASLSQDTDGHIVEYAWVVGTVSGDTVATATGTGPSFTLDDGEYVIRLGVTDNRGATDTATRAFTLNATRDNRAPTAEFTVGTEGGVISVDASASNDPDGTIASYQWSVDGPDGTLTGSGRTAQFDVPDGSYTVTLTVTDNDGESHTTTRAVTVNTVEPNSSPEASFAYSIDRTTNSLEFTNTSTDPDGDDLSLSWNLSRNGSFVGGTRHGTTVAYNDLGPGEYTMQLIAEDEHGATDMAWPGTLVTFTDGDDGGGGGDDSPMQPIADMTISTSDDGTTLSLESLSYDPDGQIASHLWTVERNGQEIATKSGRTATVQTKQGERHTVYLTVTDGAGHTSTASKQITTEGTDTNEKPVAVATAAVDGNSLLLDGSTSTDPDGQIESYEWVVTDASGTLIAQPTGPTPRVSGVGPGDYTVALSVTDDQGAADRDETQITVESTAEKYDHTVTVSANDTWLAEGSVPVVMQASGSMETLVGPDVDGGRLEFDALSQNQSVNVAYNGELNTLDWANGSISVVIDGQKVDPYDVAGGGPRKRWTGGTSKVAEVTLYQSKVLYQHRGWAPARSIANYVAGALRDVGISHDILYCLGPLEIPHQQIQCSTDPGPYNYLLSAFRDTTADDGGTAVGDTITRRKNSNMILVDQDGGGCSAVGGDIGTIGASGIPSERTYEGQQAYAGGSVSGGLFAAMHEIGHNFGYGHENGGGRGWYENPTPRESEWNHTPCSQTPGTTNRCGFEIETRIPEYETGVMNHLYYTDCTGDHFKQSLSGGSGIVGNTNTQALREGRGPAITCPVCNSAAVGSVYGQG